MADLPTGDPESGEPAPPWIGPNYPPTVGTVTIFSGEISGPSGFKTIGPLHIALTQTGTDETLDLSFTAAGTQTIVAPMNATVMVIDPPAANTTELTLNGAVISGSNPSLISLPNTTGGSTYTLAAVAAVVGNVEITFA